MYTRTTATSYNTPQSCVTRFSLKYMYIYIRIRIRICVCTIRKAQRNIISTYTRFLNGRLLKQKSVRTGGRTKKHEKNVLCKFY